MSRWERKKTFWYGGAEAMMKAGKVETWLAFGAYRMS
jgi:hypothetical protein